MKYLIYLDQEDEDSIINSVLVEEGAIETAKNIIDDMGSFIGVMDYPAIGSNISDFRKYAKRKYVYLLKRKKELEKEREVLSKKSQDDLDQEYANELLSRTNFISSFKGNETCVYPYVFKRNIKKEKNNIRNELKKIIEIIDKI